MIVTSSLTATMQPGLGLDVTTRSLDTRAFAGRHCQSPLCRTLFVSRPPVREMNRLCICLQGLLVAVCVESVWCGLIRARPRTYWRKLPQSHPSLLKDLCTLLPWSAAADTTVPTIPHLGIHVIALAEDHLCDSYLDNLDTASQAWTSIVKHQHMYIVKAQNSNRRTCCSKAPQNLLCAPVPLPTKHFPRHADRDKYSSLHRDCPPCCT